MATNGVEIYLKLLYHLCIEHIDYALNMTLQGNVRLWSFYLSSFNCGLKKRKVIQKTSVFNVFFFKSDSFADK